jgi:hypothetical protein
MEIINLKKRNPLIRIIIGAYLSNVIIFCSLFFLIIIFNNGKIQNDLYYFLLPFLLLISTIFVFKEKQYIIQILIENGIIEIIYYEWLSLKKEIIKIENFKIEYRQSNWSKTKVYVIEISNKENNKKIVQNIGRPILLSEWNKKNLFEVYEKIKKLNEEYVNLK